MKTINFTILLLMFITITQLVSIEQSNETLNPDSQDPTQKQIQIIKRLNNLNLGIPDSTNSSEVELKLWSVSSYFGGIPKILLKNN